MKILAGVSWILCLLLICGCVQTPTTATPTPPPSTASRVLSPFIPYGEPSQDDIELSNNPEPATPAELPDEAQISYSENYRTTIDGFEYFFDTSKYIYADMEPEPAPDFLLMKKKTGDSKEEPLGVYGFSFKANNGYIYIDSADCVAGDYEVWTTRAVSLKDGKVSEEICDASLFFPTEGETIYYTEEGISAIYACKPDLTVIKDYPIHVPDWNTIMDTLATMGFDGELTEDYFEYYVDIDGVQSGWIYFSYEICERPQLTAYIGNYNMSLDGKKIEKTGKDEYFERTDYWGGDGDKGE